MFLSSAGLSLATARILPGGAQKASPNLVQRLGYPADARVLILTADEFGECHAANLGVMRCWETGLLRSATLVTPGPWAPEAAEYVRNHPDMDVGVHLTLTMGNVDEIGYRPFLPRTEAPGLYTPQGYLWPHGPDVWKHATVDEIKRESRAQIQQAIRMGIDPTHLDPHDGLFYAGNLLDFAKLYAELAKEFSLPVRMPWTRVQLANMGQPGLHEIIAHQGVLMNDEGIQSQGQLSYFRKIFHERAPGTVTEMYVHPGVESAEMLAVRKTRDWWKIGAADFQIVTKDGDELRKAIKDEGFIMIGWRQIRELQRHGG